MAAAGPAPRGFSLTGARPLQYGAAANNTSSSTQRKQHWRLTALAPATPRLAARAADAHRGWRSPAGPHGKCSPRAGRRRGTTCADVHCGGRSALGAAAGAEAAPAPSRPLAHPPSPDLSRVSGTHGLCRSVRFFPRSPPLRPRFAGRSSAGRLPALRGVFAIPARRRKPGREKGNTCSFSIRLYAFVCLSLKCSQVVIVHKKR